MDPRVAWDNIETFMAQRSKTQWFKENSITKEVETPATLVVRFDQQHFSCSAEVKLYQRTSTVEWLEINYSHDSDTENIK